jgi:hypothetical protein
MAMQRIISRVGATLFRHGARIALESFSSTANQIGHDTFRQVFTITLPVTVYVYAAHSRVIVRRKPGNQIELEAAMRAAFGLSLAVDQDEAGVYIVAKRKPVAGTLARADFVLIVPPEAHILAQLTPGKLVLDDVDGLVEVAPIRPQQATVS